MEGSVLVIVDMQVGYTAATRELALRVAKRVERARRNGWYIVVVEWLGAGDTRREITDALVGYDQVARVYKTQRNGAGPVVAAALRMGWLPIRYEVIGVYYCFCVRSTALGLRERYNGRVPVRRVSRYSGCETIAHNCKCKGMVTV